MQPPSERGIIREGKEIPEGKTAVLIAGLPDGKMANLVAEAIQRSDNFALFPIALSSEKHQGSIISFGEDRLLLLTPGGWRLAESLKENKIPVVDFTIPGAVNNNAEAYVKAGLPFVMGTTGGDRQKLVETVENSEISAVIAPNMAVEVVRVQHAIEALAQNAPGGFKGWRMEIKESHQASKKDVSGTARALQTHLKTLGAVMNGEIISIRDPRIQEEELGVPQEHLGGHAYHWIALQSPDGVSTVSFTTKINGRQPYVDGTMVALRFLQKKIKAGSKGEVFSMVDVLRAQTGAK